MQQGRAANMQYGELPSEPILYHFPMEILLEVFYYLTLPEQICLALTSRGMFSVLGDVVHDGRVQYLPGNQDDGPPQANPEDSSYSTYRVGLLIHLVDASWSYCGHCRMLHPREQMFQPGHIRSYVYDRMSLTRVKPTDNCPFSPTKFFDGVDAWRPMLGKFEHISSRINDSRHLRALNIRPFDPKSDSGPPPRLTRGLTKFFYYKGTALASRVKLRVVVLAYDDGMCVSQSRYYVNAGTSEESYSSIYLCPHFNLSRLSYPCVLHCMRCCLSVQMELDPHGARVVYSWQIGC